MKVLMLLPCLLLPATASINFGSDSPPEAEAGVRVRDVGVVVRAVRPRTPPSALITFTVLAAASAAPAEVWRKRREFDRSF